MQRTMLMVMAGVWLSFGCGGTQSQQLAEDPTAPGANRESSMLTCRWTPPLPDDREDPCTVDNNGAVLDITERYDMREESKSQQKHTCYCK